jgi:hypothetical protein
MADLRVQDTTLTAAQTTFDTAAKDLSPVVWALKGVNAEVVGADPLAQKLADTHGVLATELGIIGQALTEVAQHASQVGTVFGAVDQSLSNQAREAR